VVNKTTKVCEPLEMDKTYRVGTNEFLRRPAVMATAASST